MVKLKRQFTEHPLVNPQSFLSAALRFDEEDLAANRYGYMTKKQRQRLADKQTQWLMLTIVAGCVLTVLCISLLRLETDLGSRLLLLVMAGSPTIALTVYFMSRWKQLKNDLYKGDVSFVEGDVHLVAIQRGRDNPRYIIKIVNLEFRISSVVFSAFINGAPYCIYYIPASKKILSAELLITESE